MAVSKVELANGEVLVDLTNDSVTPDTLAEGATAHDASGARITGTMKGGGGGVSVQADWNQTDETAADFIKNKPFGYYPTGSDTLTWDGNTEGKECLFDMMYKVSDAVLTVEDFANGFSVVVDGNTADFPADCCIDDGILLLSSDPTDPDAIPLAAIVSESVAADVGVSAGVYFLYFDLSVMGGELLMIEKLTVPGYAGFAYNKQIEKQYLPPIDTGNVRFPVFYIKETGDKYIYKGSACDTKADKTDIANLQLFVVDVVSESYGVVGRVLPLAIDTRDTYCKVTIDGSLYYTSEYQKT